MRKANILAGGMLAIASGALFGVASAEPGGTPLELSLDANRFAGPTPLRVTASATASNAAGAVRYRWCFDDGTQSDDQSPRHSFRRAGYYTVVVQAQDESGNRGRRSILLGVWPPWQWSAAQAKPLTRKRAARAQRAQRRRTSTRRKRLRLRHGLTLDKCTGQPLLGPEPAS